MSTNKIIQALGSAAGGAGGAGLNVEEVFSTYLYEGNGSSQTITNGIDLSGEGGLVWLKGRDTESYAANVLVDTERGRDSLLSIGNTSSTSSTGAELVTPYSNRDITSFNSNGFSLNLDLYYNKNTNTKRYASWTFRKAPKFFDVVTYTGDGVAGRAISHNLGSTPGCIIVKKVSAISNWFVWHRGRPSNNGLLNTTDPVYYTAYVYSPTSSDFRVYASDTNVNGETYVAYLFAHNDGDGTFGPDADQDIIKCGSYTGDGTTNGTNEVTLGWEPQWILTKRSDSADNWHICDVMRGQTTDGITQRLRANTSAAESATYGAVPTPTGFKLYSDNSSGGTFIYIAIRRGPMGIPESATDVFDISHATDANDASFPVDFMLTKIIAGGNGYARDRLRGGTKYLLTDTNNADLSGTDIEFDDMTGTGLTGWGTSFIHYNWRRAPNFFDVVAYTGNGTAGRTVSHNLGVAPEMIIQKGRSTTFDWHVLVPSMSSGQRILRLNELSGFGSAYEPLLFGDGSVYIPPTSTEFTLGSASQVNGSGDTYIAYLFASIDGVSKVGSYTGNGSSQTIDCGFSSGAKFVLIKSVNTDSWMLFDSSRGIVSGNDPFFNLEGTGSFTSYDPIDPHSSGFIVNQETFNQNQNNATYIFYAIA